MIINLLKFLKCCGWYFVLFLLLLFVLVPLSICELSVLSQLKKLLTNWRMSSAISKVKSISLSWLKIIYKYLSKGRHKHLEMVSSWWLLLNRKGKWLHNRWGGWEYIVEPSTQDSHYKLVEELRQIQPLLIAIYIIYLQLKIIKFIQLDYYIRFNLIPLPCKTVKPVRNSCSTVHESQLSLR